MSAEAKHTPKLPLVKSSLDVLPEEYYIEELIRDSSGQIVLASISTSAGSYKVAREVIDSVISATNSHAANVARIAELEEALSNAVRCGERDGMPGNPGSAPKWTAQCRALLAKEAKP